MTTVSTWFGADTFLHGGRNKSDRPIENNTRIVRRGDDIAVQLHATDVVTYHRDGSVTLDSGGWLTVTTKDRMNTFLGERGQIWSDRGVWLFSSRKWEWDKRTAVRYFDGIRIAEDGTILNPKPQAAEERQAKAEEAMAKRIAKYVDGYMKALVEGMPVPSGGDCWDCSFIVSSGEDKGKPLGDVKNDQIHGHLFSHMTDRYYVPSLIWNAVKAKGYREPAYVMGSWLDRDAYEAGTMRIRNGYGTDKPDRWAMKELRACLTKYLKRRLIATRAH